MSKDFVNSQSSKLLIPHNIGRAMNSSQSGGIAANLNTLTSSATGAQLKKIYQANLWSGDHVQYDQTNHSYYTLSNNLSYSASMGGPTQGGNMY